MSTKECIIGKKDLYLRVTIGHILDYTPGGKPPAVWQCGSLPDSINRHIDDGPQALGMLLAESEEIYVANRNQWGQNLEFSMHLINIYICGYEINNLIK